MEERNTVCVSPSGISIALQIAHKVSFMWICVRYLCRTSPVTGNGWWGSYLCRCTNMTIFFLLLMLFFVFYFSFFFLRRCIGHLCSWDPSVLAKVVVFIGYSVYLYRSYSFFLAPGTFSLILKNKKQKVGLVNLVLKTEF